MNDAEIVEKPVNSKEELRKLVADEETKKREAFEREYMALVEKYGYMITAKPTFMDDGRITALLGIIPR